MFLSIGFFAIFFLLGNLDYASVFSISSYMNETSITIIGLLLLLAAMGKSAQFGMHTWLPDKFSLFGRIFMYSFFVVFIVVQIIFAPKEEQGSSSKSIAIRKERKMSNFLYRSTIGLIVSGDIIVRSHKDNPTSRLVYQTYDQSSEL